jgi:hypothetical protein
MSAAFSVLLSAWSCEARNFILPSGGKRGCWPREILIVYLKSKIHHAMRVKFAVENASLYYKTRSREIVPCDLAKALKMEISGNGLKTFALAPTYRALNGAFRTISFAFWKQTLTELSDDPGEPVLNLNPEFDPLENDFNLKYIVWTIVSF